MSQVMIWVEAEDAVLNKLVPSLAGGSNGNKAQQVVELMNALQLVAQNPSTMSMEVSGETVEYASGTLTLGAVVATNTCEVAGTTFTAVASGASGQQFNVGGTPTLTAVNLKNVINSTLGDIVVATSNTNVVTIEALDFGEMGNGFPLAGGTNITASGSSLSGGASPSWVVVSGTEI